MPAVSIINPLQHCRFIHLGGFAVVHGSLRVTPAMAAGITDRVWDLKEILA